MNTVKRPVVLALNPSIDAEWRVAGVRWEEKNSIESERRWPGGKGVNVARWLKHLGGDPLLILPLGGEAGRELAAHLKRETIATKIIPIREPSRVNVIVTAGKQGQLRFNPAGPQLSGAEWRCVLGSIRTAAKSANLLVLSGSVPRGVPTSAYAQIIRMCRKFGVPVLLDCDGPALTSAVRERPFLVKPNELELGEWAFSMRLKTESRVAARAMSTITAGWVLVSRGAKPAMLVNGSSREMLTARPRCLKPRNTVGAGDALLAAVARQIELGSPPREWLREGLAAGTAATQRQPGELPR